MARRKRPSRRQDILDVFASMVAERGYDAVAISEVAAAVDVSKGTVVHHFGSKPMLLEEIHRAYMERRLAELEVILENLDSPAEQLCGIVYQNFFAMHYDHDARVAFAREIVRVTVEPYMAEVREMRSKYSERMREVLTRGMDEGVFRKTDPTILSLQLFGMVNWSWTWFRADGSWTVESLAETFLGNIFFGISQKAKAPPSPFTLGEVGAMVRSVMERNNGPSRD